MIRRRNIILAIVAIATLLTIALAIVSRRGVLCADGTRSKSTTIRQGVCSHHKGVAR